MVESLPFQILLGTVLGFLSGIGVGGGSLLVLWLTVVADMPPETARGVNLLFFLPAAVISLFFRQKQGSLELRKLVPAILSGCLCAAVFSGISTVMDTELLKKGFGILLLVTGVRELSYRPRDS